ncbi:MAG TPA: hypothetical protein VIR03_01235 [Candidatus Saccharimonadales bacterium]
MNNLDELLRQHQPKPKRPLSVNFTQSIMGDIREVPQPSLAQRLRAKLPVHLASKASFASLAGAVLVTGSVAAFALWPRPSVTPSIHQELPSGNHIVGYNAKDCNYFASHDGSAPKQTSESLYYEVRQGSKLTDQQLLDSLQAVCEENISDNALVAVTKQLPQNIPGLQSTVAYTISAISPTSITLVPDAHFAPADLALPSSATYTRFASDMLLYNEGNKVAYGDFKVGDTVKLVVKDDSGKSSETAGNYVAMAHPEHVTILAMLKTPPLSGDPNVFYKAVGADLVRVETCSTSPSGFCRAYEFAQ